ncbi:hypothetical protein LJE71_20445 [Xanthobacter autotrophicus]|uniref:Uncharacterized protein n=1 Tax=Xanthobacter dioxanivorans TaxID=2528964 RepID=A0A974PUQ8_9HYPH|nr:MULTISPECIES: hypothetical protein [Xanthobacter]QRG10183.1 hypothetical protein EZH22_30355 [Xanthobacter dioxanivorans]UDQ88583.1 hypothetical protein LJE71_20445 [Xanthobacter autotrophicus]
MVKFSLNATYPPYAGDLATPIAPVPERIPLSSSEGIQNLISDMHKIQMSEYARKLGLLLDFYGIPRDADGARDLLLLKLVDHHVPGMRVEKKTRSGPSQKWTAEARLSLFTTVQALLAEGRSEAAACRAVHQSGAFGSRSAVSLQRRYAEARDEPAAQGLLSIFAQLPEGSDAVGLWKKAAEAWLPPHAKSAD